MLVDIYQSIKRNLLFVLTWCYDKQEMVDFYPKPEVKLKTCQICLFAIFRPSTEVFTRMETSLLPMKDCSLYLCSVLMAIKQ